MLAAISEAIGSLRRPEYTGRNRCLPCTVVNAAIGVVAAGLAGVLAPLDATGSALVGGAALVVAAGLIALRGYLVPGTPWLTQTYLPERVLRSFEHGAPAATPTADVDPAGLLEASGVVTECAEVDDLCLTDGFRTAWRDRIDERRGLDATADDLAGVLDLPRAALTLQDRGDAFVAVADAAAVDNPASAGSLRVGRWESAGAFLADMAADGLLRERVPGWDGLAPEARGQVLNGLRVFLDACPTCGGAIEFGEETVASCCRSREVYAITCTDCGERLFEAEPPAS